MHDASIQSVRSHAETKQDGSPTPRLVVIDLFCGAGGLSLAFHRAGFAIAAAVELDRHAATTYKRSFIAPHSPDTKLLELDIRDERVREKLGQLGRIDVVVGGPPCQDFSSARLAKPRKKQRATLVRQYFRILEQLNPQAFLFENVPGLRTATDGHYWRLVRREAERLGYSLAAQELKAEEFGVPQRRHRLFVVGVKKDLGIFSFPTGNETARSVMETIGHLVPLKAGKGDPSDPMHKARAHRPDTVAYLKEIAQGKAWRSATHIRTLDCHRDGHNGHYDVYGRMRGDTIAPTMTGGCTNPSKGRFIHPCQHRGLTVREAALLQTFPPTWQFAGGIEAASQQVGNAVPVKLGEVLAAAIHRKLAAS